MQSESKAESAVSGLETSTTGSALSDLQTRWLKTVLGRTTTQAVSEASKTVPTRTETRNTVITEPSSIGRACLPGYGTSRRAVEGGHKLKRGVAPEPRPLVALGDLSRAGNFSWRMEQQRRRSDLAEDHLRQRVESTRAEKQLQREAAKAQADERWFCRAPRAPLGVAKAQLPEFHDLNEEELKLKVAQRMVFPDTQTQEQSSGTLLINGAAGEPRTFYASGRLTLRQKPRRDVSGFADVFRHGVGSHPYQVYGTLPFTSGEWKY